MYNLIPKLLYLSMQQIQRPTSRDAEQNEFLSNFMEYQSCPFCQRSFFRGKLSFHLKLCNEENPMTKNSPTTPKQKHKKNALSAATHYERCENCKSRIPSFMIGKHYEKCIKGNQDRNKSYGHIEKVKKPEYQRKTNNHNEGIIEESIFPKIKNYSSKESSSNRDSAGMTGTKNFPKSSIRNTATSIKIRQQLRCLKQAEEVQKVPCDFCGRKFSQKAALRHVPICSMLRKKQQQSLPSSKKSKSFVANQAKARVSKTVDMINSQQTEETKNTASVLLSPLNQDHFTREPTILNNEQEQKPDLPPKNTETINQHFANKEGHMQQHKIEQTEENNIQEQ